MTARSGPGAAQLRALTAWAAAGLCVALIFLTHRVFVETTSGQTVELLALRGSQTLDYGLLNRINRALSTVSVPSLAIATAAIVGIGMLRRRRDLVFVAVWVIGGANLTTQVLKDLVLQRVNLTTEAHEVTPNSMPSGHVTAVASVAVALLLVLPPIWQTVASWVAAVAILAAGGATLMAQWHRPSDVVAAVLVVLAWGLSGGALQHRVQPRQRARGADGPWGGRGAVRVMTGLAVMGVASTVASLAHVWGLSASQASQRDLAIAVSGGMGGMAAAVFGGLALMLWLWRSPADTSTAR